MINEETAVKVEREIVLSILPALYLGNPYLLSNLYEARQVHRKGYQVGVQAWMMRFLSGTSTGWLNHNMALIDQASTGISMTFLHSFVGPINLTFSIELLVMYFI